MKKNKIIKTTLIICLILLIVYAIYIIYQYNMINNLYELGKNVPQFNNIYFNTKSQDANITYYKLNNTVKVNIENSSNNENILAWNNYETNEYCTLFSQTKTYSTEHCVEYSIPYFYTTNNDITFKDKFLFALNPLKNISSIKYNGYDCYKYEVNGQTSYIDKNTFIVVYEKTDEKDSTTEYTINSVEEKDVSKPDTNDFLLK